MRNRLAPALYILNSLFCSAIALVIPAAADAATLGACELAFLSAAPLTPLARPSDFDVENISDIHERSFGVYQLKSAGGDYVVRINDVEDPEWSGIHDPKRESFVNAAVKSMGQEAQTLFQIDVRLLTENESARVLNSLKNALRLKFENLRDNRISVVPFVPGVLGKHVMARFNEKPFNNWRDENRFEIPSDIARQLSTAWTIASVLRIPDFHTGNWILAQRNRVVPIDLAMPFDAIRKETQDPLVLRDQMHPFGVGSPSPVMRSWMIGLTPRSVIEHLAGLNANALKALARRSQYEISPTEVEQILSAAQETVRIWRTQHHE